MKLKGKLFLGLMALGGLFAVASCSNSKEPTTSTTPSSGGSTTTTTQSEAVMGILLFVDDNNIYFDNNLSATEGVKLTIDGKDASHGNNAFTSTSAFKFEGTTENKLYIYMVAMTKNGNEERYTFASSIGLNAKTEEGMNVATKKLTSLASGKTRIFVSVSTQEGGWDKTLSLKLNNYIESSLGGSF